MIVLTVDAAIKRQYLGHEDADGIPDDLALTCVILIGVTRTCCSCRESIRVSVPPGSAQPELVRCPSCEREMLAGGPWATQEAWLLTC